jgi:hypothetical protein
VRWFVNRLTIGYVVNTSTQVVFQCTTVTLLFQYIKLTERQRQRLRLEFTRKCRQQAFPKFLQLFTKILSPIFQSIWTSIKNLFPHFQCASSPDRRTDCLLQCCDRQTGRQADINPVDRDFRENTWDLSWNISSFMFLVSISFVTQDCTTANSHFMHLPFLPLGSYFLLPVFLVHRGVISLNSSAAILQLSLIPFRAGSFPCLRH